MQLLTFMLGEVKYGIPVSNVQSIEPQSQAVEIPNTMPYIKGILNLHGNVIPIYSLSSKFNYPEQNIQNIVVTDVDDMQIGFEVCKVEEILDVEENHIIPMPEVISSSQKYISDVADYNKNLIVLLDVSRLISEEERQNIQQMLEEKEA